MTETNEKPSRAVRPRDAATLVLFRREAGRPKVLMGQRHRGHKFMPDAYVFPGGRVDRSDGYVPFARPLRPEVERKLSLTASPHRARALALAAVRETFEETGLILGEPGGGPVRRSPKGWQAYARVRSTANREEHHQRHGRDGRGASTSWGSRSSSSILPRRCEYWV